ncbi:MarR family winged helix-turn-helix transcriptional regulator [Antrihabitans cavernicola]|uniref:MarR family transcriptional regulator n=1 Tax=Antrihabitans cavernicola TaxID=2495913 RepID=A0A5A7SG65_9NOCA|nr:MarR family transcriptional regulator [Spelaeibacter cavernicola]KAA0023251.1 MarR family transcriptional regulator [Spelaeibacter cavernicola]
MNSRNPGAQPLSDYTGYLLRRAHNLAVEVARESLPPTKSPRDAAALGVLAHRGATSQQQIAALLHINRTLVVKLVDDLEAAHLVERRRDESDRRAYALALTDTGRKALPTVRRDLARADAELTAALTRKEARRLERLLVALLPDPSLAEIPEIGSCTAFLVTRVHQHHRDVGTAALAPIGLEPRYFGVLTAIDELGECTQQDVANHMQISAPVVLGMVDELDTAGLLVRVRNTQDRRAYRITLSAAGIDKLDSARGFFDVVNGDVERLIGADGVDDLNALLTKLVTH